MTIERTRCMNITHTKSQPSLQKKKTPELIHFPVVHMLRQGKINTCTTGGGAGG